MTSTLDYVIVWNGEMKKPLLPPRLTAVSIHNVTVSRRQLIETIREQRKYDQ